MNQKLCKEIQIEAANLFNSLAFYYNIILATMFGWGLYAMFAGEPPTAVSEETSHFTYMLWVAWQVLAPPVIWIGQLTPNQRVGWWLRWAGDSALCIMIATHIYALAQQTSETSSGYLLFILTALMLATFFMATRDLINALRASNMCE